MKFPFLFTRGRRPAREIYFKGPIPAGGHILKKALPNIFSRVTNPQNLLS